MRSARKYAWRPAAVDLSSPADLEGARLIRCQSCPHFPGRRDTSERCRRAWASLHRGSEREILEMSDNHNLGRVIYPHNCFDSFYMEVIALALEVADGMSRARAPRIRILSCSPTVSEVEVVDDVSRLEDGELPKASAT